MLSLISVLTFMTVLLMVYSLTVSMKVSAKPVSRLGKYIGADQEAALQERRGAPGVRGLARGILSTGKELGRLGIFKSYRKNVQIKLTRAHIPLKGDEFITICIISAVICFFLFSTVFKSAAAGIGFSIVGWLIPGWVVGSKRNKRLKSINNQLGDAITLISNSLKAGYSFFQAVDTVTSEMPGSISEEFAQLKKEISLGVTTEAALESLAARVGSEDLELVVTAILIQRQVGGNLAEILDNICETIRERIRIKGEVKTITAQGRMSGIIISVLPVAVGIMLAFLNPAHVSLLFTTPIGLAMIGASVFMELIGIYLINKIVKIEF